MNDDRDGDSSQVPQPVGRGTEPAEIEFSRELIRLEDRRLDEARRRTALAERALELNDEQDRRQAEYATLDLESRERADVRRHKRTGRALYALIAIAGSTFALLVALSFFGTAEQSKTAIEVLKYVASGLAGYGLVYAVLSALRRLARPRASMQRI